LPPYNDGGFAEDNTKLVLRITKKVNKCGQYLHKHEVVNHILRPVWAQVNTHAVINMDIEWEIWLQLMEGWTRIHLSWS